MGKIGHIAMCHHGQWGTRGDLDLWAIPSPLGVWGKGVLKSTWAIEKTRGYGVTQGSAAMLPTTKMVGQPVQWAIRQTGDLLPKVSTWMSFSVSK